MLPSGSVPARRGLVEQPRLANLVTSASPVLVSILGVLGSRALVVLGLALILPDRFLRTSPAERGVLIWGGLRDPLTITLALALPPDLGDRQLLIAMAFGVVLFSLLIQGVTLSFAIQRTGLAPQGAVSDTTAF